MQRVIVLVLVVGAIVVPALARASVLVTGHVRSIGVKGAGIAGIPMVVVGTFDAHGGPARLPVEITDDTVFRNGASVEALRPGLPVRVAVTPTDNGDFVIFHKVDVIELLDGQLATDRALMRGTLATSTEGAQPPILAEADEILLTAPEQQGSFDTPTTTYFLWVTLANVPSFQRAGFTRIEAVRINLAFKRLSRIERPLGGTETKTTIDAAEKRQFHDDTVAEAFAWAKAFERDWQGAAQERFSALYDRLTSTEALTDGEASFTVECTSFVTYLDENDGTWKELGPCFSAGTSPVDVETSAP